MTEPYNDPYTQMEARAVSEYDRLKAQKDAILERQSPRWTTEKPTVLGWYWWRHSELARIQMTRVNERLEVICMNDQFQVSDSDHVDECGGLWAGPVEPPK